jgi:hypothetical protein
LIGFGLSGSFEIGRSHPSPQIPLIRLPKISS